MSWCWWSTQCPNRRDSCWLLLLPLPWPYSPSTWIHAYLSRADQNHDDKMSYDEIRMLLQMINIDLSDQYAHSLFQVMNRTNTRGQHLVRRSKSHPDFHSQPQPRSTDWWHALVNTVSNWPALLWQKCDQSADGRLDHGEIEVFCRELLRRPELDAVFIRYSANGCVLSIVDLRDFLKDQGEDASPTHAQSLILTYELNQWGTASAITALVWSVCLNVMLRFFLNLI